MLTLQEMTEPVVGSLPLRHEGIRLELAQLADNGHLVPLRVVVDSPMTEAEHVRQIILLSQRNPVTRMATSLPSSSQRTRRMTLRGMTRPFTSWR